MPLPRNSLAKKLLRDLILQVFRGTTQLIFQIYLFEVRRVERREERIIGRRRVAATEEEEEDPYQNLFPESNPRPDTQSQPHQAQGRDRSLSQHGTRLQNSPTWES